MTNDDRNTSRVLPGVLSDYYSIEGHSCSYISSDVFKAHEAGGRNGVALIKTRMALRTEFIRPFLDRLGRLSSVLGGDQVLNYGIDQANVGFAALKIIEGQPLLATAAEVAEAERRWLMCVRIVQRVHSAGVICGDLCPSSFWMDRTGTLRLVSILGDNSGLRDADFSWDELPEEITSCASPELVGGGDLTYQSDIYSLGMLAYWLFGAEIGARSNIKPLSKLVRGAPEWLDEVLLTCLQADAKQRHADAGKLQQLIATQRTQYVDKKLTPLVVTPQSSGPRANSDGVRQIFTDNETKKSSQQNKNAAPSFRFSLGTVLTVLLTGSLTAIIWLNFFHKKSVQIRTNEADLSTLSTAPVHSAEFYDQLATSEDPLAHDALVKAIRDGRAADREMAWDALIKRLNRLGLKYSVERLQTIKNQPLSPGMDILLSALDPTMPDDARKASIQRYYLTDPRTGPSFIAALVLDSPKSPSLYEAFASIVGDSYRLPDATTHSTVVLIFASPGLSHDFGAAIRPLLKAETPQELLWLLRRMLDNKDPDYKFVLDTITEGSALSTGKMRLAGFLKNRTNLPPDVQSVLIKGIAGNLTPADLVPLGPWYDIDADLILIAICSEYKDPALLQEAFDILAVKNIRDEAIADLVEKVRRLAFADRGRIAHSIGIVGAPDLANREDILAALNDLATARLDSGLAASLLKSSNREVVIAVVEKYGSKLKADDLISLLDRDDADLKRTVLRSLKDTNDVKVMHDVLSRYQAEKDAELIAEYESNLPFLKGRKD